MGNDKIPTKKWGVTESPRLPASFLPNEVKNARFRAFSLFSDGAATRLRTHLTSAVWPPITSDRHPTSHTPSITRVLFSERDPSIPHMRSHIPLYHCGAVALAW